MSLTREQPPRRGPGGIVIVRLCCEDRASARRQAAALATDSRLMVNSLRVDRRENALASASKSNCSFWNV
jgi:hypothetical protein